ncbi:hypothetical protein [Polycladidibacter stylochi]|uniref:hypothetical protein n=1 Tax=Polycladidibacter stylochi TaxID=1807766 RepID=UPI000833B2CE|nr:hypothetical protein [Pseudovibrio stylochi]
MAGERKTSGAGQTSAKSGQRRKTGSAQSDNAKNITIDLDAKEVASKDIPTPQNQSAPEAAAEKATTPSDSPAKETSTSTTAPRSTNKAAHDKPDSKTSEPPVAATKTTDNKAAVKDNDRANNKSAVPPTKTASTKAANTAQATKDAAVKAQEKPKSEKAADTKAKERAKNTQSTQQTTTAGNQPQASKKSGSGALTGALLGSVFGAALVLGGLYGAHQAGYLKVLTAPQADQIALMRGIFDANEQRLQDLEGKIAALQNKGNDGANQQELTGLEQKITAQTKRIDEINAAIGNSTDDSQTVSQLTQQLTKLEQAIAKGQGGDGPALINVNETLAKVQSKLSELTKVQTQASVDFETLKAQQNSLEKTQQGLQKSIGTLASLQTRLQDMEVSSTALAKQQGEQGATLSTSLASMQGELTELMRTLSQQQKDVDAHTQSLGKLSASLANVESKVGSASAQERAARAIAVSSLSASVESGKPYAAELTAVKAVVPQGQFDFSKLDEFARLGIPTNAELIASFGEAARAMSKAQLQKPDQGVVDRLLTSAQSLVSIRRPSDEAGTTPGAILGQMEVKVEKGDLAAALAAYQRLPEAMQEAGADWADHAQARLAADALVKQITNEVLVSLGSVTQ